MSPSSYLSRRQCRIGKFYIFWFWPDCSSRIRMYWFCSRMSFVSGFSCFIPYPSMGLLQQKMEEKSNVDNFVFWQILPGRILDKEPSRWNGSRRCQVISAGFGKEKSGCPEESDGYPHFLKISHFEVDKYFFNFSVLHKYQLCSPHPVKSNVKLNSQQSFYP